MRIPDETNQVRHVCDTILTNMLDEIKLLTDWLYYLDFTDRLALQVITQHLLALDKALKQRDQLFHA